MELRFVAVVVALLALLAACPRCEAAVFSGRVDNIDGFLFVDKFCFDTTEFSVAQQVGAGTLSSDHAALMRLTKLDAPVPLTVAVYNDDVDVESLIRNQDEMTCEQLLAQALVTETVQVGGPSFEKVVWQESRPRFWFVGIATCGETGNTAAAYDGDITLEYELQMLNPGGFFSRQFSKNHQGEFEAYMVAFVVCAGMAIFMLCNSFSSFKAESLSSAFRVLTYCVVSETVSIACMLVHAGLYADNGVGLPVLALVGRGLDLAQNVVFMLLLVTMMKGWKTSYTKLKTRVVVCNVGFALLLVIAYTLVLVWDLISGIPANAFYLYESPPGIGIVILRLFIAIWFMWSSYKRLSKSFSQSKKRFFAKFMFMGLLYFLALPMVVMVAAILQPWVRSKVAVIMTVTLNTLAYVPVGYFMWPSRLNDVFNTIETIAVRSRRDVTSTPAGHDDPADIKQFARVDPRVAVTIDVDSKTGPDSRATTASTIGSNDPDRRQTSSAELLKSPQQQFARHEILERSSRMLLTPSHAIPRGSNPTVLPPLPALGVRPSGGVRLTGNIRPSPANDQRPSSRGSFQLGSRGARTPDSRNGSLGSRNDSRPGSRRESGQDLIVPGPRPSSGGGEWVERQLVDASAQPFHTYSRHLR